MGAEKITGKIISDANAAAEELVQKAKSDAAERCERLMEETGRRIGEIEKKTEADCSETERRRMLTASLDSRKNSLSSRRRLMDKAFDAALERICGLADAEYAALVTKLVAAASETGEEKVIVPVKDEKRYKGANSLLSSINAELKSRGKTAELVFGGVSGSFAGGALLSGETADVDCTFESLVAQFREDREMEVADILFGSGV